jgi:hypothetical protein
MTELEMQIIQAMRNASEENLARALAFLCRIELEEKPAAAPLEGGEVA